MACVQVLTVDCVENPAPANSDLRFSVTVECQQALEEDLEWRLIYVGNPATEAGDQVLDEIELGPIQQATMRFVFEAPPPDLHKVAEQDQLDSTIMFFSVLYRGKEFCRIGYYTWHTYDGELAEGEEPPRPLDLSKVTRHIDIDQPRVTRYPIAWDTHDETAMPNDSESKSRSDKASELGESQTCATASEVETPDKLSPKADSKKSLENDSKAVPGGLADSNSLRKAATPEKALAAEAAEPQTPQPAAALDADARTPARERSRSPRSVAFAA